MNLAERESAMDSASGSLPLLRFWGRWGLRHGLQQLVKQGLDVVGLLFPPSAFPMAIGVLVVAGQTADLLHLIAHHPHHTVI